MVDCDLSLTELLRVCRACACLRFDRDPEDWFQPFLVARLSPLWPALADRVAQFSEAQLQTLADFIQVHQRFGRWVRPRYR